MDVQEIILIKGILHDDIISCVYNNSTDTYAITFLKGKTYDYSSRNIKCLNKPKEISKDRCVFKNKNDEYLCGIKRVLIFNNLKETYYRIVFGDESYKTYPSKDLIVEDTLLKNAKNASLLEYYKCVSLSTGLVFDGKNMLEEQFKKIFSIEKNTVLPYFFKGYLDKTNEDDFKDLIFPFGSNYSQIQAVSKAMKNKVSIIEGPPGTGKTQTILNIIGNILLAGKNVAVVSYNNSATENIFEKLQKNGYSYIAAQLGSSENKNDFIDNRQSEYPDFTADIISDKEMELLSSEINILTNELIEAFQIESKIVKLKSEKSELEVEKKYFDEDFLSKFKVKNIFKDENELSINKVVAFWDELEKNISKKGKIKFFFKLKSYFTFDVKDFSLYKNNAIVSHIKYKFYELKFKNITLEIENLNDYLLNYKFQDKIKELTNKSTVLLKGKLFKKYKNNKERKSLKNFIYDYVIVDEASQVDLATGVLTMSCAKNIVIVGDLKQLPNVIDDKTKIEVSKISKLGNIQEEYRYENHSLLSSVSKVFEKVPRTLLREHYRCHPKIINFCNKKFYNNELVIMTKDNGEKDVLKAIVTPPGNYAKEHYNQRQIDIIEQEILPHLNSDDVGIICPYNEQVNHLKRNISRKIDVSTVHKFQGREKSDIIISTVDNEISNFTDDPNLLNVAVSRAKNKLCIVVSNDGENSKTNINDLIRYIKYNNFEIKKTELFSIFDMLYKYYYNERKEYLKTCKKVSEYDSENLMFSIIDKILSKEEFSKLGVVIHYPLKAIIRDLHKLNERETKFLMNDLTHVDFLIYNKIDKSPVLVIEVDGYNFHKEGSKQKNRDMIKDKILEKYNLPIMRFNTIESQEEERLKKMLITLVI